ncbi:hypothetical protein [Paracidobacterium acidisoli]|nr:hypothetical protein [Paracidobacterium acidisoli]
MAVFAAITVVAGAAWRHHPKGSDVAATPHAVRDVSLPDQKLTPGNYQSVRLRDVCEARPYEQARVTSASLQQQILREYGMPGTAVSQYEIDFLVIPELGGTSDIHNLWPEPYSSTEWNAHVKDALEERLHQLVCERKLDLATAQHDIATNWISAYKKYFHTNVPVPADSRS